MNEPTREEADLWKELEQMPPLLRVLMKLVVIPLLKMSVTLEGFVRTRWEIVPLDELPAARKLSNSTCMDREQVLEWIESRAGFLCPECKMELKPARQEAEEIFTGVWEVKNTPAARPAQRTGSTAAACTTATCRSVRTATGWPSSRWCRFYANAGCGCAVKPPLTPSVFGGDEGMGDSGTRRLGDGSRQDAIL